MSFARWLLVHSFSIFIVAAVLLGYIYRDELQLQQAYDQLLQLRPPTQTQEAVDLVEKPELPFVQSASRQISDDSVVAGSVEGNVSESQPEEISPPAKSVVQVEAVSTLSEESTGYIEEELALARQAYWDQRYDESVARYQRLIDQSPDNVDYIGELGNVLYTVNDYRLAARTYYQAASLLLEQGQPDQARKLLSPITAMDRQLGDKLREKLNQHG
jgi:tetratricopeptide (TPR) repeat protein